MTWPTDEYDVAVVDFASEIELLIVTTPAEKTPTPRAAASRLVTP